MRPVADRCVLTFLLVICSLPCCLQSKKRYSTHRELAILERISALAGSAAVAGRLADALVAMLTAKAAASKRGRGGAALNEPGLARALGALAALWTRASGKRPIAALLTLTFTVVIISVRCCYTVTFQHIATQLRNLGLQGRNFHL